MSGFNYNEASHLFVIINNIYIPSGFIADFKDLMYNDVITDSNLNSVIVFIYISTNFSWDGDAIY